MQGVETLGLASLHLAGRTSAGTRRFASPTLSALRIRYGKFLYICLLFSLMQPIRIAILDMYAGHANQGMRGIRQAVNDLVFPNHCQVFDVRRLHELPDTSFDIYISSGGPGSPVEEGEAWIARWRKLMDLLWENNLGESGSRKHVFLVCHSFQMLIHHWKMAPVIKRNSPAFGIFPVHKTQDGFREPLFDKLPDPFYAVDSRNWQVLQPFESVLKKTGAKMLCIEKERPHVPFERAAMGIRFSDEFIGFQFHPEADEFGMKQYFHRSDKKQHVIEKHGIDKYHEMIECLKDKNKISLTRNTLLPGFLNMAVKQLRGVEISR